MDKDEIARIVRFSLTGLSVAALYVMGFVSLVGAGVPTVAANTIAFLLAVLFQYVAQTSWTFRKPLKDRVQGFRFVITVGLGIIYSSVISSLVGPSIAWPHWFAASLVAVTLPIINYCVFRFWVFTKNNEVEEI